MCCTATVFAQKITLNLQKVKLEKALSGIKEQTGVTFAYSQPVIDPNTIVSINVKDVDLPHALSDLLRGTDIQYEIGEGKIYLFKKEVPVKQSFKSNGVKVRITGTVLDTEKEPLIGVSISQRGTTNGTLTDANGRFEIAVPQNTKLTVSFIGYIPYEFTVGNKKDYQIELKEDVRELDDVVVIGYGVQNKRDVSTSISTVKSDKLENLPKTDFRQALAGRMAGVQVIQAGGGPEGTLSVRIRGTNTITAGNEPLYVVDGVPMSRGLMHINGNDIESVEVLKDASSAAIYGSRGSNGVVLITTKNASNEKLTIQYDGNVGVQQLSKKIPLLNAYQYAQVSKDAHDNAYMDDVPGASPNDPNLVRPQGYHKVPEILFPYLEGVSGLVDTDWQDEIYRNAITTSHNLSFSQKSKSTNYFVSANYHKQEGIIICSDVEKYSLRLNLDSKFNKIKFGINFAPAYSVSDRVDSDSQYSGDGVVASAMSSAPIFPVYNADGSFNFDGNGLLRKSVDSQHTEILNPVAIAHLSKEKVERVAMIGKLYAEYEFTKGLSYNISIGGDFYSTNTNKYRSSELETRGVKFYGQRSTPVAYASSHHYYNWLVENKISYNSTIAQSHKLSAVIVQSAQKETHRTQNLEGTGHPTDYIEIIPSGGGVMLSSGSSAKDQWSLASYLARIQYSYNGKYLASVALRSDGSSRFGKDNRWGYFPSGSVAWRLSDENFFRNAKKLSFIDDLKFRFSMGVTGNFNIGNYDHLSTVSTSEAYILGEGDGSAIAAYSPSKAENRKLKWEKSVMMNTGFDLTLLNGLFRLTVEYYNNNTKDLLLTVPVPHTAGYSTSLMNIGKVNNRGWEFQASSQKQWKDFGFSLSANLSTNRNEVKALGPENADIISTGSTSHTYYLTSVGQPIGSYYLLVQDGIFSTIEELSKYPHFDNTSVGDFRFVDVDGDGVLDVDKDRTIVGNYMPDFTYGFSLGVNYKSFDLVADFQGVYGNEIINLNRRYNDNMEGHFNGTTIALDRWRSESEPGNGQVMRANRKQKGNNGRTSTWHVEDGSYLRLQNLTIGYTLPSSLTKRFNVQRLRAYVSGVNLFTITGYTGYNPEVNRRPSSATTPGEDYGSYPLNRVYTFGLNITF